MATELDQVFIRFGVKGWDKLSEAGTKLNKWIKDNIKTVDKMAKTQEISVDQQKKYLKELEGAYKNNVDIKVALLDIEKKEQKKYSDFLTKEIKVREDKSKKSFKTYKDQLKSKEQAEIESSKKVESVHKTELSDFERRLKASIAARKEASENINNIDDFDTKLNDKNTKKQIVTEKELIKEYKSKIAIIKNSSKTLQEQKDKIKKLTEETKKQIKTDKNLNEVKRTNGVVLSQLTKRIKNAVDTGTSYRRELQKEADEFRRSIRMTEYKEKSLRDLIKKLKQTKKGLDNHSKGLKKNSKEAVINAKKQDILEEKLAQLQKRQRGFGKTTGQFITQLAALGVSLYALVGVIKTVITTFADYEQTMRKVQIISNATSGEMLQVTEKTKELAQRSVFTVKQIGDTFEQLSRMGFKVKDSVAAMNGVVDLAISQQMELKDAGEITVGILRSFSIETAKAGGTAAMLAKSNDLLASTANNSATTVNELAQGLKFVGPVANSSNQSLEEVMKVMGLLADNMIRGEMAGTSLRGALLRLQGGGRTVEKAMKLLGMRLTDFQDDVGRLLPLTKVLDILKKRFQELGTSQAEQAKVMKYLVGMEATTGMLAVMNSTTEQISKMELATSDYTGTAERMREAVEKGLQYSIKQFNSNLNILASTLGEKAAPATKSFLDSIINLIKWINNLDRGWHQFIVSLSGTVTVLMTLSMVLSGIVGLLKLLGITSLALAGRIALIGGAVTALIAVLGAWYIAVKDAEQAEKNLAKAIEETGRQAKIEAQQIYLNKKAYIERTGDIIKLIKAHDELVSKVKLTRDEERELTLIEERLSQLNPDLVATLQATGDELWTNTEAYKELNAEFEESYGHLKRTADANAEYLELMKDKSDIEKLQELLWAHDELSASTKKTKEEQIKLHKIEKKIKDLNPKLYSSLMNVKDGFWSQSKGAVALRGDYVKLISKIEELNEANLKLLASQMASSKAIYDTHKKRSEALPKLIKSNKEWIKSKEEEIQILRDSKHTLGDAKEIRLEQEKINSLKTQIKLRKKQNELYQAQLVKSQKAEVLSKSSYERNKANFDRVTKEITIVKKHEKEKGERLPKGFYTPKAGGALLGDDKDKGKKDKAAKDWYKKQKSMIKDVENTLVEKSVILHKIREDEKGGISEITAVYKKNLLEVTKATDMEMIASTSVARAWSNAGGSCATTTQRVIELSSGLKNAAKAWGNWRKDILSTEDYIGRLNKTTGKFTGGLITKGILEPTKSPTVGDLAFTAPQGKNVQSGHVGTVVGKGKLLHQRSRVPVSEKQFKGSQAGALHYFRITEKGFKLLAETKEKTDMKFLNSDGKTYRGLTENQKKYYKEKFDQAEGFVNKKIKLEKLIKVEKEVIEYTKSHAVAEDDSEEVIKRSLMLIKSWKKELGSLVSGESVVSDEIETVTKMVKKSSVQLIGDWQKSIDSIKLDPLAKKFPKMAEKIIKELRTKISKETNKLNTDQLKQLEKSELENNKTYLDGLKKRLRFEEISLDEYSEILKKRVKTFKGQEKSKLLLLSAYNKSVEDIENRNFKLREDFNKRLIKQTGDPFDLQIKNLDRLKEKYIKAGADKVDVEKWHSKEVEKLWEDQTKNFRKIVDKDIETYNLSLTDQLKLYEDYLELNKDYLIDYNKESQDVYNKMFQLILNDDSLTTEERKKLLNDLLNKVNQNSKLAVDINKSKNELIKKQEQEALDHIEKGYQSFSTVLKSVFDGLGVSQLSGTLDFFNQLRDMSGNKDILKFGEDFKTFIDDGIVGIGDFGTEIGMWSETANFEITSMLTGMSEGILAVGAAALSVVGILGTTFTIVGAIEDHQHKQFEQMKERQRIKIELEESALDHTEKMLEAEVELNKKTQQELDEVKLGNIDKRIEMEKKKQSTQTGYGFKNIWESLMYTTGIDRETPTKRWDELEKSKQESDQKIVELEKKKQTDINKIWKEKRKDMNDARKMEIDLMDKGVEKDKALLQHKKFMLSEEAREKLSHYKEDSDEYKRWLKVYNKAYDKMNEELDEIDKDRQKNRMGYHYDLWGAGAESRRLAVESTATLMDDIGNERTEKTIALNKEIDQLKIDHDESTDEQEKEQIKKLIGIKKKLQGDYLDYYDRKEKDQKEKERRDNVDFLFSIAEAEQKAQNNKMGLLTLERDKRQEILDREVHDLTKQGKKKEDIEKYTEAKILENKKWFMEERKKLIEDYIKTEKGLLLELANAYNQMSIDVAEAGGESLEARGQVAQLEKSIALDNLKQKVALMKKENVSDLTLTNYKEGMKTKIQIDYLKKRKKMELDVEKKNYDIRVKEAQKIHDEKAKIHEDEIRRIEKENRAYEKQIRLLTDAIAKLRREYEKLKTDFEKQDVSMWEDLLESTVLTSDDTEKNFEIWKTNLENQRKLEYKINELTGEKMAYTQADFDKDMIDIEAKYAKFYTEHRKQAEYSQEAEVEITARIAQAYENWQGLKLDLIKEEHEADILAKEEELDIDRRAVEDKMAINNEMRENEQWALEDLTMKHQENLDVMANDHKEATDKIKDSWNSQIKAQGSYVSGLSSVVGSWSKISSAIDKAKSKAESFFNVNTKAGAYSPPQQQTAQPTSKPRITEQGHGLGGGADYMVIQDGGYNKYFIKQGGGYVMSHMKKKMAEGGLVPEGFQNDSFVAGLESGEVVLNESHSKKLWELVQGITSYPVDRKVMGNGIQTPPSIVINMAGANLYGENIDDFVDMVGDKMMGKIGTIMTNRGH